MRIHGEFGISEGNPWVFFPMKKGPKSMGLPALNIPINFWPKQKQQRHVSWVRLCGGIGTKVLLAFGNVFWRSWREKPYVWIFYTSWTTIQIFGAKTGFSMLASIPFWAKPGTTFLDGQPCVFSEELPMPVGWCVTCVGLNENSQRWMKTMKIWPEKTGQSLGRQCGLLSFFCCELGFGETWRGPTFRWHLPTMLSYLRSWKTIIPCEKTGWNHGNHHPRCSMYGIFTYIWAIFGINVGKYSIHGASGHANLINPSAFRQLLVGRKPSCGPNRIPKIGSPKFWWQPQSQRFFKSHVPSGYDSQFAMENMENLNHKWRFLGGKIIYKWAIFPWLC